METIIMNTNKNILKNIFEKIGRKNRPKIRTISSEHWESIEGNSRLLSAKNNNTNPYINNSTLYLDQSKMLLLNKIK